MPLPIGRRRSKLPARQWGFSIEYSSASQLHLNPAAGGDVPAIGHSCCREHSLRGEHGGGIRILVRLVDNFPDPGLNDGLSTLITGKERHIHLGALKAAAPIV